MLFLCHSIFFNLHILSGQKCVTSLSICMTRLRSGAIISCLKCFSSRVCDFECVSRDSFEFHQFDSALGRSKLGLILVLLSKKLLEPYMTSLSRDWWHEPRYRDIVAYRQSTGVCDTLAKKKKKKCHSHPE